MAEPEVTATPTEENGGGDVEMGGDAEGGAGEGAGEGEDGLTLPDVEDDTKKRETFLEYVCILSAG